MLKPLGNRVLIGLIEKEETSSGGIVLPDNVKKGYHKGVVLAVGPGTLKKNGNPIPVKVKKGEVVLYEFLGATYYKTNEVGRKLFVVSEDFIIGVEDE